VREERILVRVARFYAPGDLRIEETAEPSTGVAEVKIRVRGCSVCGTDVKILRYGHHRMTPPRVMGHEIAGEITEVGAAVDGWNARDRVQVIAAVPCGSCRECNLGRMTVCTGQEHMGFQYDGGFAEYMIVPGKILAIGGLNRIPGQVDFAEASMTEPLACVLNGQELAGVRAGDHVVVIGAGPVGCLHARLARYRGATRVFLVDLSQRRLDMAAALVRPDAAICSGATDPVAEVLALTGGHGADVVITAAASGAAQEQALHMAARRGRISFFGGLPPDQPFINCDSNLVHYRELTIVGASGASPAHNRAALDLIATGEVAVADLITLRLPLDQVGRAIDVISHGEAIKVTIEP
jgi:L-iditol 2-dehydrogenase